MNIGICTGNGLTIDLQHSFKPKLDHFNPYKFFSWKVNTPYSSVSFLENLPNLKKFIQSSDKYQNDFEIVEKILDKKNSYKLNINHALLLCETQHFLAIAFSYYQTEVDKIDFEQWHWTKWFKKYKSYILFGVSFNYDLVLERTLNRVGITNQRLVANEQNGIFIIKPHGSIDFEVIGISTPVGYPLNRIVFKNNTPIKALNISNCIESRTEVNIVLPNEYAEILNFQWVEPGYRMIKTEGHVFSHFLFIGLSYNVYDQNEINYILDNLNKDCIVIIADPNPNKDFVLKVQNKFQNFRIWNKGKPESL